MPIDVGPDPYGRPARAEVCGPGGLQIANAVPVRLAEAVGRHVASLIR